MIKYDNCKGCGNVNCEHYGKDREFICPGGKSCKVDEPITPFDENMFIVYTGNRFNQILIFPTWNKAAAWLRSATRYTETEIARAIKTTLWNGYSDYISVTDY